MPECGRMGETAIVLLPPLSALSPALQGVLHGHFWIHQLTYTHSTTLMLTAVPWLPFRPGMPTVRCILPLEGWPQVRVLHWPWRQHHDNLNRKLENPRCLAWEEQVQNVGSKFPGHHGLSTSLEVGEGRMWSRKSRTGPRALFAQV